MTALGQWKQRAHELKREALALYLACRDPRTPWYAKVLAAAVVAYALSPIDLIPDFVPVVGYLDDAILIPIGILLAVRLIPAPVMQECRARAGAVIERPTSRAAAAVIVGIWLLSAALVVYLALRTLSVV